ncbi:putative ATPase [Sinorhizobium terangae]|nr:putative ATPase [Sinorhizobium terangae]
MKIRGTAQHIAEKYAALARDAQSSGDRVMAENYLQHAEHYNRIIAAAQAQMQDRFQREERQDYQERDVADRDQDDLDQVYAEEAPVSIAAQPSVSAPQPIIDGSGPQPVIEGTPAEVAMEEETPAAASSRPASRRRSASRPRRQPRRTQEEASDDAQSTGESAGDAPALATSE